MSVLLLGTQSLEPMELGRQDPSVQTNGSRPLAPFRGRVSPGVLGHCPGEPAQGQALQKLGRAVGDAPEGVKPRVFLPGMERGVRTRSLATVNP